MDYPVNDAHHTDLLRADRGAVLRMRARGRLVLSWAAFSAVVLLSTALALTGCGGPRTVEVAPTPSPRATATPAVLYQADFSQGLAAWHATDGWSVVAGNARSDTGDKRMLTIPFTPPAGDYAVEVTIQVINVPKDGGYFVLSADPGASTDGFSAGVQSLRAESNRPSGDHPSISTWIMPQEHQADPYQVIDFEPYTRPRLYRVEVRGGTVTLTVDGRPASYASTESTVRLSLGPVHLTCSTVVIAVSAVRVLAL
jgi:hypothetical protein